MTLGTIPSFLTAMPVDPAVYPFFDLYPAVEQYTPVQPSKSVSQQNSSVVSKKSLGMKLGYPVIKICKSFLVTCKLVGCNRPY